MGLKKMVGSGKDKFELPNIVAQQFDKFRKDKITENLNLQLKGLEIAPYFRPTLYKIDYNVYYVDYVDNDEIQRKALQNPPGSIVDIPLIDWVWLPGKPLKECVPDKTRFEYAIASHVIEHVPDVLGWVNEVFELIDVGGIFSLVIPDKRRSMDFYRNETTLAELVHNWVSRTAVPSPMQLMDFCSQSFKDIRHTPATNFDLTTTPFEAVPRAYTDKEALDFALWSHNAEHYIDAHCTVWTPESFVDIVRRAVALGLLNVAISDPFVMEGPAEFMVQLTKLGEPRLLRSEAPIRDRLAEMRHQNLWLANEVAGLREQASHATKAFREAAESKEALAAELSEATKKGGLRRWLTARFYA